MPNTSTTERLRQLVRMLSSDQEGEVLSAARAINRTLKSNGLDIHFLADGIGHNDLPIHDTINKVCYDRGYQAGLRAASTKQTNGAHNQSEPSWHEIACECAEHADVLFSDREREFVDHMVRTTVRGGKV
jgi:hypothetical protein